MRDSESKGCFQGVCDFSTFQHVTYSMTVRHWLYWRKWGDFACFTQTFANGVVQEKCQNLFYCDVFVEGLEGIFATCLGPHNSRIANALLVSEFCWFSGQTKAHFTIPFKQPSKHQHHLPHLRSNDPTRVPTAYRETVPWMEALLCCSVSWAVKGRPENCVFLLTKLTMTLHDFATLYTYIPTILFPISSLCFTLVWLPLPIIAFLYHIIFGRLFWNCCLPALWLEGVFIEPIDSI